jgi:hypothetical protein
VPLLRASEPILLALFFPRNFFHFFAEEDSWCGRRKGRIGKKTPVLGYLIPISPLFLSRIFKNDNPAATAEVLITPNHCFAYMQFRIKNSRSIEQIICIDIYTTSGRATFYRCLTGCSHNSLLASYDECPTHTRATKRIRSKKRKMCIGVENLEGENIWSETERRIRKMRAIEERDTSGSPLVFMADLNR